MTTDALLRRIRDDLDELASRGPWAKAALKELLAGELEDRKIETLAATPGGLAGYDGYIISDPAADLGSGVESPVAG
jgi:hypothetical protein